eukprot:295828-Pelagomonas_calceolata.AAC.5
MECLLLMAHTPFKGGSLLNVCALHPWYVQSGGKGWERQAQPSRLRSRPDCLSQRTFQAQNAMDLVTDNLKWFAPGGCPSLVSALSLQESMLQGTLS